MKYYLKIYDNIFYKLAKKIKFPNKKISFKKCICLKQILMMTTNIKI